jgi:hypothetical protein
MIYYIIDFSTIYNNINSNIAKFCDKFEIDFSTQKIKTKRELLIYYTIIQLLQKFSNETIEKPIIIYKQDINNSLLQFCLKKVSDILVIPIYNCENFDGSEGIKQELFTKADKFYDTKTFTTKKLEKLLQGENFDQLILRVKEFKGLRVNAPQKEHISG